MNIVFLDAYTANRGDLSWEQFSAFGEFICYNRTGNEKIIKRSVNADIIITNKTCITDDILSQLPKLKYICVAATGVNIVDLKAAGKRDIPVSNVVGYSTNSVAQNVFSHILNLVNKAEYHSQTVSSGCWTDSPDFTYCDFPIFELSNMNIGIVGFGNIGRAVAKIANGFNMTVNVFKPGKILGKPDYVNVVDKETLLKTSDIITLHCPLNKDTEEFVKNETIKLMKSTAYIINTGRGGLINEKDLAEALNSKRIGGAGLDVLSEEPPIKPNPLINAKNCRITPHAAWTSVEARKLLIQGLVDNIKAYQCGNLINVVN